jgi:Alginate export
MRTLLIVVVMFLAGSLLSRGQPVPVTESPVPARTYHLLREDDDWSFLADSGQRQDFWDPIKYMPLRAGSNGWFLSMGGEAREMWEQIGNDNWGQQPFMNGYFDERYMFFLDVHYGTHFRSFVELKSGLNSFRIGGPRSIDEKKMDFQAAFFEVGTGSDHNWIKFRAGRHEMEYGSGRLIDVREGPNVRLSFDGFKVKTGIGSWRIDGFAVRPDLDKPGFFNNAPNHAIEFWGVYGVRPLTKSITLDIYYLGLGRKAAAFNRGTADEVRHSIGARLSRPVAQTKPGWDFDYEALGQFGSFGSANIRAWTVASETGYRLPTVPLKPRFSVKADISSGDDPKTNTLGTFNPLFPKGNYFGVLATTGPGPINFIDVHPHVEVALPHSVTGSFDWIFQWRQSVQDGVYAVPGFLIIPAGKSDARFVGHRPGTEVHWQANRHLWVQADYGIFYAGKFVKESQPARNLNYWALWTGYKF